MTERPIIFSTPMVRAILDGRKTQTRRVIKLVGRRPEFGGAGGRDGPDWNDPTCWGWEDHEHGDWITIEREPGGRMCWRDWRGAIAPGDKLWVRETFCYGADEPGGAPWPIYKETYAAPGERTWETFKPWKPSIHMPRWASRITLEVTDVRVQRLDAISQDDAKAEGAQAWTGALQCYRTGFMAIWQSIHGPGSWEANPWVVAVSFSPSAVEVGT